MNKTNAERLFAYLLAPDKVPAPDPPSMPEVEVLRQVVEEHRLPLDEVIAVNGLEQDPVVASASVQAVLALDRRRHQDIAAEYRALLARLAEAGIPHVLLKAVYGVPYRSDNIDILIPEGECGRVGAFLGDLGYIHFTNYMDRSKELYKRIGGSRLTGMFHLHRRVAWYAHFVDPDLIFAGARDGAEAGLRIPDREVALAIIGCHALYEDAAVRFIELHKVRLLLRDGPFCWDRLWQIAEHRGFDSGLALCLLILDGIHKEYLGEPLFDEAVRQRMESHLSRVDGTRGHYRTHVRGRALGSPYRLSKYFGRRCLFRMLKRSRIMSFPTKIWLAGRILKEGLKQVTGIRPMRLRVVAVCGPDGCGKTTQVEQVARLLGELEFPAAPSWLRIGDSPILNLLKRPFRRRARAEVETGQASEQGVFRSRLLRRLWSLIAVTDYVLRQYVAIGWRWVRGRVTVADRYHVDALADLAMRCGPEVLDKRWVAAAMRLLPRARPAVVLDVPDATVRRRQQEEYVEGLSARNTGYYAKAAEILGAQRLSGEQNPDDITESIIKEFLRQCFHQNAKQAGRPHNPDAGGHSESV
jgi:thymidylate kinase